MNKYLDYFEEIEQLGILDCNLSAIHPDVITELAEKGRYYDAVQLRDMASKVKQEAIIICFLHETAKTILDYLVSLFKRILLDTNGRAKNEVSTERRKYQEKIGGNLNQPANLSSQPFLRQRLKNLPWCNLSPSLMKL